MTQDKIEQLLSEIQTAWERMQRPFPLHDCRGLPRSEDFVPDLDLFCSTIAGYCSRGRGLTRLGEEERGEAQRLLQKSFFERYREHLPLQSRINPQQTPQLWTELQLFEEARATLLELLSLLKAS